MSAMVSNFNNTKSTRTPPMTLTENGSRTFSSSGNPCLDFFFHVVPNTPTSGLKQRLYSAWAHNPLTTLKLICNLRGVRGTGKSDKEGFYTAALWLHENHPKPLACNVASFADFGYIKDLLELLYRILEGPEVREIQKSKLILRKNSGGQQKKKTGHDVSRFGVFCVNSRKQRTKSSKRSPLSLVLKQTWIAHAKKKNQMEKEIASELRKEKKVTLATRV
ncbi:hypothetical protein LWI28_014279 [Acer negundo]|uniref:DUF2828 domain-containing protein n=1 Tax=Acer negundo TaxID=4023 RepID=A0AAD5ILR6_ACENE|nr:hypothetical protein LWI28_014279 [Acer negundo]